jgi:hypothetical protein
MCRLVVRGLWLQGGIRHFGIMAECHPSHCTEMDLKKHCSLLGWVWLVFVRSHYHHRHIKPSVDQATMTTISETCHHHTVLLRPHLHNQVYLYRTMIS